jgi:hypothetical protein
MEEASLFGYFMPEEARIVLGCTLPALAYIGRFTVATYKVLCAEAREAEKALQSESSSLSHLLS